MCKHVTQNSAYFCSGIMPTAMGKEGNDGGGFILNIEMDDHGHLR